ncbi:MAG: rod shape-determining protein MreC [Parachlamydiales bacterium]|jgi:cell shape-determining protein MreC
MKKRSYTYLILPLAALILVLNISRMQVENIQGWVMKISAPLWNIFQSPEPSTDIYYPDTIASLEAENNYLRTLIQQELQLLDKLSTAAFDQATDKHRRILEENLRQQLEGLPARVIYRTTAAWNSSLWIDVGTEDNQTVGSPVISKNSPVLSKGAVVGVIDYVGEKQSRVRLITDSGLTISVRAARGGWRDQWLAEMLNTLQRQLSSRNELFDASEEKDRMLDDLAMLGGKLQSEAGTILMAKGELNGSSAPLWRSPGQRLKGIGFNYDFPDEEGPARDLRSGAPEGSINQDKALPVLKVKDLLMTTGYDGVFPPGLPVGEVVHIQPLGEGDYYYSLEALPAAGNLDDLSYVLVLPSNGYDKSDLPPPVLWDNRTKLNKLK